MRKITVIFLALLLALPLAACGRSAPAPTPTPPTDVVENTPEPTSAVSGDASSDVCSYMDLEGVWLQTGYEIEGDVGQPLPLDVDSLVFKVEVSDDTQTLLATAEDAYAGYFNNYSCYYDRSVTLLEQPIYEGCGNEVWCVRVGDESPLSESGYPIETETYVTLIDQNTLLRQLYFSYDDGAIPMVSYQTYKRFLPEASDVSEETLAGSDFELAGYIDADGVRRDEHPEYRDFRLHLDANGGYRFAVTVVGAEEYTCGGSTWALGCGGTLLLYSEDYEENCFVGAAAIQNGTPELFLWDNAGRILCLKYIENGDDRWTEYVDTMSDIEGNAFAAPDNALCVIYNQNYTELGELHSVPFYEVSDNIEAQYVMVTAVEDGSYFWLQDKEGYCAEGFGYLDAGDSVLFRCDIPASNGFVLQMSTSLGDYNYELTQSSLAFDENWGYITT